MTRTPSTTEHLAVYGSLMREEGMLAKLGVERQVRFLSAARLPGRLFDLGEFPGLKLDSRDDDSDHDVPGELFAILDPVALAILDEYEGCRREGSTESPFARQQLRLYQPPMDAWVYIYQGDVTGRPEVTGISWPEYKARKGRRQRPG